MDMLAYYIKMIELQRLTIEALDSSNELLKKQNIRLEEELAANSKESIKFACQKREDNLPKLSFEIFSNEHKI